MNRLATIAGVGTSNFGKQAATVEELVWLAIEEALAASGVEHPQIEAIFVGTVFSYTGTAHRALHAAGFAHQPIVTVDNACASGTLAVHLAVESVVNGKYKTVLAVGMEKMSDMITGALPTDPRDSEAAGGMIMPAMYAMSAHRYMAEYGVTAEDLAYVSVKNHHNALGNPRAQYRGDFTIEQVLESRTIADPLTILQCSPISDGAAAAIITHPSVGRSGPSVLSSTFQSGATWPQNHCDVWNYELIERTAGCSFDEAGVAISDIDVVELHDAFTIGEIVAVESMGFFARGSGAAATRDGATLPGASVAVNTSGGLLSRGHPLGATGVAQLAEVVWQLTGKAEGRQLDKADIGVVETMGGSVAGLSGNGCLVLTLGA